jgi:hypothetical protein
MDAELAHVGFEHNGYHGRCDSTVTNWMVFGPPRVRNRLVGFRQSVADSQRMRSGDCVVVATGYSPVYDEFPALCHLSTSWGGGANEQTHPVHCRFAKSSAEAGRHWGNRGDVKIPEGTRSRINLHWWPQSLI